MQANSTYRKPDPSAEGIAGVDVVVSPKYAQALYDSCKEVQIPSANDKAMSIFCGRRAEDCTPFVWLNYMGNTGNGQAPFTINYINSTTPWHSAGGQTLIPFYEQTKRCNETVTSNTDKIGKLKVAFYENVS